MTRTPSGAAAPAGPAKQDLPEVTHQEPKEIALLDFKMPPPPPGSPPGVSLVGLADIIHYLPAVLHFLTGLLSGQNHITFVVAVPFGIGKRVVDISFRAP